MKGIAGKEDEEQGIALKVGGVKYLGWTSARVTRRLEALAGDFELVTTDRWSMQTRDGASEFQPGTWPFRGGDQFVISIDDVDVMTGAIDSREMSYGATDHTVSVKGRDAAGELVDCSVLLDSWEFSNVDVLTLANKITAPFGIKVSLQTGLILPPTTIPKKYSIDPGDTAANALENLCRVAGLLAVSDGVGHVTLVRAETLKICDSQLIERVNIKAASATYDLKNRFHKYVVLGSHKGKDDLSGKAAAGVLGQAIDEEIQRSRRVLVIRPEGNVTTAQATRRAEWEATVRKARSASVSITVPGWKMGTGELWPLNRLVKVYSPRLELGATIKADNLAIKVDDPTGSARRALIDSSGVPMLITGVTYSVDVSGGQTTQLELRPPGAFNPDPVFVGPGIKPWDELAKGV